MHACIQWTCACVREGKGRGVQFRRKCEGASERKSLPSSGNCDWTGEMQRQSDDAPRVHWSEPVEAPSAQPLASISEESLLPQPWAKTVSSTSKSALSGLNTVSATTDSLLSLAQTGSGAVLSSAKGFVVGALESVASSTGFSVVEKTANTAINATNNLFNLAELLTFGTFHVASASTKLSLKAASETVNIFNSLFGSTESSRALTHLVHLVHQEILLHDPDFAQRGFIGNALGAVTLTGGITKALAAYACLQVMTHERTVESRRVARLLDAPVALNQAGLGSASAEAASAEKALTIVGGARQAVGWIATGLASGVGILPADPTVAPPLPPTITTSNPTSSKDARYQWQRNFKSEQDFIKAMQKLTPTPGPSSRLSLSLSPQPLTIRNTPTSSPGLGSAQNLIDDSLADGASEIFEDARSFLDTASSSYPTPPDSRRASTATTTPSTTDLDRKLSTHSLSSSALDEPSFQPPSDPYAVQPATGGNWFFDYVRSWIPVSSPAEMYNSTRMPGGFESGSVLEEFDAYCAGEFSVLEDTAGVSTVFDQVTISRPRKDGTVRRTLRLNVNHFADLDENASIAHGSILRRGSMSSLLGDDSSIVSFASSMLSQGMGRHFPMINLVDNLSRYCRYATASYGSEFMTVFDVGNIRKLKHVNDPSVPMNHVAFATHVNIPVEDILHSSFNDPQPLPSEEEKIEPVVHYVSLDREAGVVVVTLRGTLSLSDLLIDLKFDYATYKGHHVHAGMLHTATLLWQRDSCLFKAVHQALTANPSYGLVLIGHSLGGGVATLLAHEWSTPSTLPKAPTPYSTNPASGLPPHRPLHCYSFGTPCVVSHTLSTALQPYTTTVIHGNDMIPTMSVGLIRDLKTVTFHLLDPVNRGLSEKVIARTLALQARGAQPTPDESDFFYSVISSLRGSMRNARLYPGGTVYWVSHTAANAGGAAASHVVLRRCEDVREICHEPVFSARMMSDHVPKSYEDCIGALKAAVDAKREE